jgi:hypothetical protein
MNKKLFIGLIIATLLITLTTAFTPLEGITTTLLGATESGREFQTGLTLSQANTKCDAGTVSAMYSNAAGTLYCVLASSDVPQKCTGGTGYSTPTGGPYPNLIKYCSAPSPTPTPTPAPTPTKTCYKCASDGTDTLEVQLAQTNCVSPWLSTQPNCQKAGQKNCYKCNPTTGVIDALSGQITCPSGYVDVQPSTCGTTPTPTTPLTINDVQISSTGTTSIDYNSAGQTISVRVDITSSRAGKIILEAGLLDFAKEATITISANQCNPDEPWYANSVVNLPAGKSTIYFTLIPKINGALVTKSNVPVIFSVIEGTCGNTGHISSTQLGTISIIAPKPLPTQIFDASLDTFYATTVSAGVTTVHMKAGTGTYFGNPASVCKNIAVIQYDKTYVSSTSSSGGLTSIPREFTYENSNYDGSQAYFIPKTQNSIEVTFDITFNKLSPMSADYASPRLTVYGCDYINGAQGVEDSQGNLAHPGQSIIIPTTTTPTTGTCQSCQEGSPTTENPFDTSGNLATGYAIASDVSREATSSTLTLRCEQIENKFGNKLKTYLANPQCYGTAYTENTNYFKPKVTRTWYVPDGKENTKSAWVEITGTRIPEDITNTWVASSTHSFAFEISNEDATSYTTTKGPAWLETLKNWFIPIGRKIYDYTPHAAIDRILLPANLVEEARKSEYLSLLQAEISIYSLDAAKEAYNIQPYSRSLLASPYTLYTRDSCMPTEANQGWIKSYTVLISGPVDGVCLTPGSTLLGQQLGWGCKGTVVLAKLKIPENGDAIASGTSNWNKEGLYQLNIALYDRCYNLQTQDAPSYLKIATKQLVTPAEGTTPGATVCCEYGGIIFGLFKSHNSMTQRECSLKNGIGVDQSNCEGKQPFTCYKCDLVSGSVLEKPSEAGACPTGFVDDQASQINKCKEVPPPPCDGGSYTKTCKACDGTTINDVCSTKACPTGYYKSGNDYQSACGQTETNCYVCSGTEAIPYTNNPVRVLEGQSPEDACLLVNGHVNANKTKEGCANILTPYWEVCPDDSTKWCAFSGGKVVFQGDRKDPIALSDLKNLDKLTFWSKTTGEFIKSSDNPICLKISGDVMCTDDAECLAAKDSSLSTYKENKQVYDVLAEVTTTHMDKFADVSQTIITGGLNKLFNWVFDINLKKSYVEQYGVCVEKERGLWAQIRRFVADLFGLDVDDPMVTYIIIGGAVLILGALYYLSKPPKPQSGARMRWKR